MGRGDARNAEFLINPPSVTSGLIFVAQRSSCVRAHYQNVVATSICRIGPKLRGAEFVFTYAG